MASGNTSGAVVIMYRGNDGTPVEVEFTPEQIGLSHSSGYTMFEVFENEELGSVMPAETVKVKVNPNGSKTRFIKKAQQPNILSLTLVTSLF